MGINYKTIIYFCLALLLSASNVLAFSSTGSTDKSHYEINDTINYTGAADQNLTSNITIYLLNSSGYSFNHTSLIPNATNYTTQLNSTVLSSGEYTIKTNFTFNSTYYETSQIVKISKAQSIVISTNKPAYLPGEKINFTVSATDATGQPVSGESVTIRFLYSTNDTALASVSSSTNSAGEYKGTFTAPNTIGTYRLTVNDWVAVKLVDISTFDLVAFTGDSTGNIKSKFSHGDTIYVYMDLFDTNKTRYTGTETLSLQLTFPNGTQNTSITHTFSGSRINTSFIVNNLGEHSVKVTAVSSSKAITLPVQVGKYEMVGWLEKNSTASSTFFPGQPVNIRVKVFNVSTGETIKTANLDEVFELTLLDSSFVNASSISNVSSVDASTGVRTFSFNASNNTGLYYVKIALNQTVINLDMKVGSTLTVATPVDQSYSLKNVFVGNKQTIRIITTLSNSTHSINATNVSVVSLKSSTGTDITSSTVFNTSLVDYNSGKAGLVEFSAPSAAGMYFIKTLINNNIVAETQFFMKLYTACVQLEGYRWFVSSNDDANLTIKVSEAQDIGLVDSLAGNSSDSTNTAGSSSFGTVYGMHDCYSDYKTTASGTSSAGNNTANIRVAVIKITNTLNGEDVTTKVANLPNNNTDDNGKVSLRLTKPSGGWDGGTYVVELELRDKNNNTDKGFGAFQVKNMWINIWPKQISGVWKWYFSPTENMTFDVNAYNSTGTWYYYGQNDGVGDNCYLLDVFYQGNGAEWFWPPKQISTSKYTWECTNSISPAKGRFTLNITPSSAFDSGYYMVRVKVNTSAGVGDSGEGWLAIRAYNVYVKTGSSNYYDSWYRGVSDNVSVKVEVTNASSTSWECGWSDCPSGQRVADTLNVSVKLLRYDQWPAKDYSTDKYNVTMSNSTSQNVSTRHINTTSGIVNITLIPNGGTAGTSWGTGYYSAAVTVDGPQGKEIGNYWFEIRSFFANLQTVKPGTLAQAYGYSTGQNITVNVSATNKPNWLGSSSYNVALTNVPVNITSMKLSYWDQTIYQMREIPVVWSPNSTTTANPTINATTTINVTATSDLTPGNWYNLEAIITDSSGNNQTGWASFQIKDFTFSTRTTNWKYNFNNSENITLEAAVCDGDTWWCDFSASSYSGNAVNVSVAKLMKSDSWPYTAVSGWSAEGIQVSSSNNGKGNITIVPTSNLSGGYYSAELSAKYASGSGSAVTSSVWFRIESFKLSGSAVKWEYKMSENASIRITPSSAATLSDVKLDCGYWPGTSYSLSGGTLSANSTSLSAGDNIIMLSPAGSGKWASGYCSGWATVTSGGESQTVYISFSMKAFTLSNHQNKYSYLKNETVTVNLVSDTGQGFNITDINMSFYDSEKATNTVLKLGTDFTSNASNQNFTTSAVININSTGNWSRGYYNGQISVIDSSNAAITQTVWFYFDIKGVLHTYGWPVSPGTDNYYNYNTSSNNITMLVTAYRYNVSRTDYWPFTATADINVTVTGIEKQSCASWPCTYSNVTGWTAPVATSKSDGTAHVNITRSNGWASGWHYMNVTLKDSSTGELVTFNRWMGFWVNS